MIDLSHFTDFIIEIYGDTGTKDEVMEAFSLISKGSDVVDPEGVFVCICVCVYVCVYGCVSYACEVLITFQLFGECSIHKIWTFLWEPQIYVMMDMTINHGLTMRLQDNYFFYII